MYPNALLVVGCASIALARHIPPQSSVTAAPDPAIVELRLRQAAQKPPPNPISMAKVLLTAFPPSLIAIAATDPAAVPIILWSEFLDGSTPAWFAGLPDDIRTYLSEAYVGLTAPPAPAATTPLEFAQTLAPSEFDSAPVSTASPPPDATPSTPPYSDPPASPTATPPASDLSTGTTLETTTASEEPTESTESPSVLPTETPQPSQTETSDSESSGLSKSSKIGIGVGVPFGVIAIAAVVGSCLLCRRRRRARSIDEKDDDSDTAAFMTPAQLYGVHRGGPYDSASSQNLGIQNGAVGGETIQRRLSLPRIDTDPFRDPLPDPNPPYGTWESGDSPTGGHGLAGYSNHKSSPARSKRRTSGASLRSIEEVDDEDGDLAGAGSRRRSWSRRRNGSGQIVSPLLPHDPMEPPFPKDPEETTAAFATFRGGSLKENRRGSGGPPNEGPPFADSPSFAGLPVPHTIPRKEVARKSSQTIGGGYRNLPSPHLRSPSPQSYKLPPGEWIEDGEHFSPPTNGHRRSTDGYGHGTTQ